MAEVSIQDGWFLAAKQGRSDDLQELSTQVKDVNMKDATGNTALHYSAQGGHVDCVNLLIKAKANINAVNNSGDTPLHKVGSLLSFFFFKFSFAFFLGCVGWKNRSLFHFKQSRSES